MSCGGCGDDGDGGGGIEATDEFAGEEGVACGEFAVHTTVSMSVPELQDLVPVRV
jgi:hypothetical protein